MRGSKPDESDGVRECAGAALLCRWLIREPGGVRSWAGSRRGRLGLWREDRVEVVEHEFFQVSQLRLHPG